MIEPEIELIWETDALIAVNKPAGLSTQAPRSSDSLEIRLRGQLNRADHYLSFPHRLDRGVSGVILVALTKKAARLMGAQFATRKTSKHYLALVQGHYADAEELEQHWTDYLRKIEGRPCAEACSSADPGAKLASTIAKTIEFDPSTNRSRLELSPVTGRMHQLRLQSALRGHPIVGDEVYGATKQHTHRILLHAHRLAFHDPSSGRRVTVEAACPF